MYNVHSHFNAIIMRSRTTQLSELTSAVALVIAGNACNYGSIISAVIVVVLLYIIN